MGRNHGDPDPVNGPIHNRSCTDILFLIAFILSLGVWGLVGYYGMTRGSVNKLLAPIDSNFKQCGVDPGLEGKNYLLYLSITECLMPGASPIACNTRKICVKECPKQTAVFMKDTFATQKLSMVCTDDIEIKSSQSEKHIKDKKCTEYVIKSRPVLSRCFPDVQEAIESFKKFGSSYTSIKDEKQLINGILKFVNFEQISLNLVHDLIESRWLLVAGLSAVAVVCFVYILLLRWVVGPVVWGSIAALIAVLAYVLYLSYDKYSYYKSQVSDNEITVPSMTDITDVNGLKNYSEKLLQNSDIWLGILIIVGVILIILSLIVIFLRKRLQIAIALIREGSKAIFAVKSTVLFPIFPWLLQCLVIAYGLVVCVHLLSLDEKVFKVVGIANDTACDRSKCTFKEDDTCSLITFKMECGSCGMAKCYFTGFDNPLSVIWLHAVNTLCSFWAVYFVSGLADMMLAGTFATWYWTFHKKDVPLFTLTVSIYRTVRYHMGTVAFGSLIIAIIRILRLILEYIDHKLKKYNNCVVRSILCLCKCCFTCLEKLLKIINKNVYIMCAVRGSNFCSSARSAFSLIMRNIVRVAVLDKVTGFIFFLSKLLISIGVGVSMYFILERNYLRHLDDIVPTKMEQLNYNYVPAIILGFAAYLMSSIFFNVYAMAVDTLFLCFLEDSERNDGSAEKPYFMPKNLMKILGKKNKQQ